MQGNVAGKPRAKPYTQPYERGNTESPAQRRNSGPAQGRAQGRTRGQFSAPAQGETNSPARTAARFSAALAESCIEVLAEVLHFERPADAELSAFFRRHREAGQQDRALIAETVYSALRHGRYLNAIAPQAGVRRLVFAVWATQFGANLRELENCGLQRGDREWLAAVKESAGQPQSFEDEADLPDWVIAAMRERVAASGGDDAALLAHAKALQQPAPLDLRVNLLRMSREEALAKLNVDGIAAQPTPYSPAGIRLAGKPALNKHPLFLSGEVEVQDEGSQLLAWLVDPRRGEMVVDFCAGAGGKTLALGALMKSTGRLYAFDVSAVRLEHFRPRLARSGLSNVHPQRIARSKDAHVRRLAGKIDRVLVDAPCSGLGTLRRNPDLKYRHTPETVKELNTTQSAILEEAAQLVKPGGRLVYATCSILQSENEDIVSAFLARHADFRLLPAGEILRNQRIELEAGDFLELWPDVHGTDGFFAAVLERRKQ